jgi:hypothetical protein
LVAGFVPQPDLRTEPSFSDSVSANTAIWHDRILENVVGEAVDLFDLDSSQVGIGQITTYKHGSINVGSYQSGVSQIAATNFGTPHLSLKQIGLGEVNAKQGRFGKNCPAQVSTAEVCAIQTSGIEKSSTQISSAQIDSLHIGVVQIQPTKIDLAQVSISDSIAYVAQPAATEIPLPSSITLQQLLNSHNFNLQNTTIPTWLGFFQGTSPFNLTIEIQDLPTGQLAEAQITQFSNNGTPTGGTLYLDTDANGLGWFIDPTPWENTELQPNPNRQRLPRHRR